MVGTGSCILGCTRPDLPPYPLQIFLTHNRSVLQAYGVFRRKGYVPRVQIGHHELSVVLARADENPKPLLADLQRALSESASRRALLSSEEIAPLASQPDRLAILARALRATGRTVKVVAYLQPQAA